MSELVAYAYVNWGTWLADCPRDGCLNAEHFGVAVNGHVGGLTLDAYFCGSNGNGCGLRCRAEWPPNRRDIEALLADRPPAKRNWRPGETLADLLAENLEHGVMPLTPEALEGTQDGKVFQLVGDHLEVTQPGIAGDVARLAIGRG